MKIFRIFIFFLINNSMCLEKGCLPASVIKAAKNSDIKAIDQFLKNGGLIDTLSAKGNSLLLIAMQSCTPKNLQKKIEFINFLIKSGANVNLKRGNISPLARALNSSQTKFVEILVATGAKLNDTIFEKVSKNFKQIAPNIIIFSIVRSTVSIQMIEHLISLGAQYNPFECIECAKIYCKNKNTIKYFESKIEQTINTSLNFENDPTFATKSKLCKLISEYTYQPTQDVQEKNKNKCLIQ